jgi:hypothetical protein
MLPNSESENIEVNFNYKSNQRFNVDKHGMELFMQNYVEKSEVKKKKIMMMMTTIMQNNIQLYIIIR